MTCVTLDRDSFNRLLGPLKEILKRNMDHYIKYNFQNAANQWMNNSFEIKYNKNLSMIFDKIYFTTWKISLCNIDYQLKRYAQWIWNVMKLY